MATSKVPFSFNLEEEYLQKIRYIAKQETRSVSNMLEHLCKREIERYEGEHGKIVLDTEE